MYYQNEMSNLENSKQAKFMGKLPLDVTLRTSGCVVRLTSVNMCACICLHVGLTMCILGFFHNELYNNFASCLEITNEGFVTCKVCARVQIMSSTVCDTCHLNNHQLGNELGKLIK